MLTKPTLLQASTPVPTDRVLRWPEVQQRVGICRSLAHQLAAEGRFPRPIKLAGGRASGWLESEIAAFLAERIAERDGSAQERSK